ncbi:unnamed protein product [Amoebophrya sp. A25]|nr:unnamed protein product [Amoebophrya sp. A25]|eukprot:GSA25T00016070001.1
MIESDLCRKMRRCRFLDFVRKLTFTVGSTIVDSSIVVNESASRKSNALTPDVVVEPTSPAEEGPGPAQPSQQPQEDQAQEVVRSQSSKSLWIFADAGGLAPHAMDVDDDVAVSLLVSQEKYRIAGITATYGNAPTRVCYENLKILLHRLEAARKPMGIHSRRRINDEGRTQKHVPTLPEILYRADECALPLLPGLCRDFGEEEADVENTSDRAFLQHLQASDAKSVIVVILGPTSALTAALRRGSRMSSTSSTSKFQMLHLSKIDSVHFVGGSLVPVHERDLVEEHVSLFYHLGESRAFLEDFLHGMPTVRKVMYTSQTLNEVQVYDKELLSRIDCGGQQARRRPSVLQCQKSPSTACSSSKKCLEEDMFDNEDGTTGGRENSTAPVRRRCREDADDYRVVQEDAEVQEDHAEHTRGVELTTSPDEDNLNAPYDEAKRSPATPFQSYLCPYVPTLLHEAAKERWKPIFGQTGQLFDLGVVFGVLHPEIFAKYQPAVVDGLWPFRMRILDSVARKNADIIFREDREIYGGTGKQDGVTSFGVDDREKSGADHLEVVEQDDHGKSDSNALWVPSQANKFLFRALFHGSILFQDDSACEERNETTCDHGGETRRSMDSTQRMMLKQKIKKILIPTVYIARNSSTRDAAHASAGVFSEKTATNEYTRSTVMPSPLPPFAVLQNGCSFNLILHYLWRPVSAVVRNIRADWIVLINLRSILFLEVMFLSLMVPLLLRFVIRQMANYPFLSTVKT